MERSESSAQPPAVAVVVAPVAVAPVASSRVAAA